jgi:acetoacetyl-CoA synthetase
MVRLADFVDAPTVAEQAQVLERLSTGAPGDQPKTTVVPLRAHGSRVPLFCLHAINGGVYFYQALLPLLHPAQPVYGIQAVGMDGTEAPLNCMQDIAARQADEIRCIQAHGPYLLCGYSAGGRFAMETARVLMDTYHETVHVLIIDDHLGVNGAELARQHAMRQAGPLPRAWMRLQSLTFALLRLPMRYKRRYLYETIARKSSTPERRAQRLLSHQALERQEALMPPALLRVRQGLQDAIKTYEVRPYRGTLKYLRANDDDINIPFFRTCEKVGLSAAAIIDIPGTHATLMKPPYVEHVAEQLNEWLQASLIGSVDAASGNYRGLTPP